MDELLRHLLAAGGGRRESIPHRVVLTRARNHGIKNVSPKLAAARAAGYVTSTGRGRNRRHALTEAGRKAARE